MFDFDNKKYVYLKLHQFYKDIYYIKVIGSLNEILKESCPIPLVCSNYLVCIFILIIFYYFLLLCSSLQEFKK